jgi:hypothetical protein
VWISDRKQKITREQQRVGVQKGKTHGTWAPGFLERIFIT